MSTDDLLKPAKYSFIQINQCNMCGANPDQFTKMGVRLNTRQGFWPSKKPGQTSSVVRCNSCGLVFTNPMPKVLDLSDHYDIPPESYWQRESLSNSDDYFQEQIKWYKELSHKHGKQMALDIGAGLGKCMKALMKAGFTVKGIEASESFAKKAMEMQKFTPEQLLVSPIEQASFDSDSFDFITFGAVLEHLYDPAFCIKKAMSWLKPSGLIHIEVPSASWLVGRLVNLSYKLSGQPYVTNLSPMHHPYHLYEFTLNSFIKNGLQQGYEIADHRFYVGNTFLKWPLSDLAGPLMKMTKTGMQLTVWLKKPSTGDD